MTQNKIRRYSLLFGDKAMKDLLRLTKKSNAQSIADIIRESVALYKFCRREVEKGIHISVVNKYRYEIKEIVFK